MSERQIPFGRPWITDADRAAVMDVLQGHILTHGPECKAFEEEFAAFMGCEGCAVSTSSGMAALHLAYFFLGTGPGDEVIVPAETHVATANAVEITGARPVFVDCELATGCIDPESVEAAITPRTRAISLVHFDGIPADMDAILALAEEHNLRVIEDCALALGARYKGEHVGIVGDFGIFSFYPVKHITTAEGGMFTARDPEEGAHAAHLRAHGVDRKHNERKIPGLYDVTAAGLNYRMSEMQAALGRSQLKRMDQILSVRREHFTALKRLLVRAVGEHIHIIDSTSSGRSNSFYCMTVVLEDALRPKRDDIILKLNAAGVGTSIYYPNPVPATTYYREKYGYEPTQFPNAERISYGSIALPVGPHLQAGDVAYIAETFAETLREFV